MDFQWELVYTEKKQREKAEKSRCERLLRRKSGVCYDIKIVLENVCIVLALLSVISYNKNNI